MADHLQPDRFGTITTTFGVLGPIQVVPAGGETIVLPSVSQRRLVAVLALHAPSPVRAERLADLLQVSPSGLRTSVTRLRKAVGHGSVVSMAAGYRLTSPVDAQIFCRAVSALSAGRGPTESAVRWRAFEDALELWRGPAFDEFAHEEWARAEATRLTELHAAATEDYAEELVLARRWSDAIARLSVHIARHPFRDRPRGLLLKALTGAGRQADALRAYRDYWNLLAEEVGTEPSAEVRRLEQRVAGGWNGIDTEPADPPATSIGRAARRFGGAGGLPKSLATARNGPFVGRSSTVDGLYEEWCSGRWRALLVAGEPGIGKSRLLAELAHHMHQVGRSIIVARCDEDYAVSYRPWTELLQPIVQSMSSGDLDAFGSGHLGALSRIVPEVRQLPGTTTEPGRADANTQRALLGDAVVALLRVVGPVVLVIDDIHWIDEPSLAVLRRVVTAEISDLTIIGAYRDTDLAPRDPLLPVLADLRTDAGVRRVMLLGIDGAAVVELVERSTGRPLDASTISLGHAIHSRTAGNPLFVNELISHLAEQQANARHPDPADRPSARELPDGLVEVIARRLARLGDDVSGVLRVAAAIGQRFDVGVVEAAVALDGARRGTGTVDVLAALERARDGGVLVDDDDGMGFRHAVIRSALLDQMSTTRRQRLHHDVARVLEQIWATSLDRHLEVLAYHHDKARSVDAPRWYRRAAVAAARLLDASAADLAARGLELLATDGVDAELRCDLLIARAVGLRLAGRETIADAKLAADAAIALGDPERIANALLSLSVRSLQHDASEHLAFVSEGLAHLTDPNQVSRWNVAAELSIRKMMMPSASAADHRRELLDVVDHLDPSDVSSCQIAMRCARSLTSTNLAGDAAPIAARFSANCRGVDSEGLPVELGLSTMWLHLGDRTASDRNLDIASADPRRRHWLFDCQVRQRRVMRSLLDGRWSVAADEIDELREEAGQDANILLGCLAQQGWLQRETGDAETAYQETRVRAEARPGMVLVQALLASDAAEAGHLDVARQQLERFASDPDTDAGLNWMTVLTVGHLAWAAVSVDARGHAAALRRRLAPYSGQMGVIGTGIYVLGAIDRLLAGLADLDGDHGTADALFTAALDQERAVRSPPLEARTRHWWGRALCRRGDAECGGEQLGRARSMARQLQMSGLVDQIDSVGVSSEPGIESASNSASSRKGADREGS